MWLAKGLRAPRPSRARERIEDPRQRRHGAPPGTRRRVVVGVVQQQHRSLVGAVGHARGDRLRRGARLPVAAPLAPQQRAPAMRARLAQRRRVEHAVGRPVQAERAAGRRLDRCLRARDVLAHLPRRQAQQVAVAVAVQADPCPAAAISRAERGVAPHLLADEEERRPHALAARISSTAGVPCACGPSSNVSAYPRPLGGAILDAERLAQRRPARRRAPGSA